MVKVLVTPSCPTLCDPIYCSSPGSSIHGILQEGILEWVAIPFTRASSEPRDRTWISRIAGRFFAIWAIRGSPKVYIAQLCLTLCDPMDYIVQGDCILQARMLERLAFPFSRGSSQHMDRTQVFHIAGRFFTIWATREAQEYWSE